MTGRAAAARVPPHRPGVRVAAWARPSRASALQDALALTARPNLLSFALGLPAPELFPSRGLADGLVRVMTEEPRALQYGPPPAALREHVVALMARRGVRCRESEVLLTTGAQQGISLLFRLLLDPGGSVLMEEAAYPGALQVLEALQPRIHAVRVDFDTGVDPGALRETLEAGARPSLLYCIPDGHNPLSISLGAERRERLVELAREYDFAIVEDDAYGLLQYAGPPRALLRALGPERVFSIGSFSKVLAPGLRAGWIVGPEALIAKLANLKEATDINTGTLNQQAIARYLGSGEFEGHLARLVAAYRERRDTMAAALRRHLPTARWVMPDSGAFFWLRLSERVDTVELLRRAVEQERIAFVPGCAFQAGNGGRDLSSCLRLNFTNCRSDQIDDGIARLGRLLSSSGEL